MSDADEWNKCDVNAVLEIGDTLYSIVIEILGSTAPNDGYLNVFLAASTQKFNYLEKKQSSSFEMLPL